MRRLRNISPALPPAVFDRVGTAVVASAVAHVLLIYGFVLPDGSRSRSHEIVIHARLDPVQRIPVARSAETAAPGALRRPKPAPPPDLVANELPAQTPGAPQIPGQSSPATAAAEHAADAAPAAAAVEAVAFRNEVEMAAIPDPVVYEARELDVYPRSLRPISPTYPASARDEQLAGSVTLLVSIDEGGRVLSASIVDAEPGGVFDQAAREAVVATAFYPAQRNGRTVRSQTLIKVEFDPRANL